MRCLWTRLYLFHAQFRALVVPPAVVPARSWGQAMQKEPCAYFSPALFTHDSRDKDHAKLGSLHQDNPSPENLNTKAVTKREVKL